MQEYIQEEVNGAQVVADKVSIDIPEEDLPYPVVNKVSVDIPEDNLPFKEWIYSTSFYYLFFVHL